MAVVARNMRTESEFGLPTLPDPFGAPIVAGASGQSAITGLSDADAILDGAAGAEEPLRSMGEELREVYAVRDTFGTSDDAATAAGTQ